MTVTTQDKEYLKSIGNSQNKTLIKSKKQAKRLYLSIQTYTYDAMLFFMIMTANSAKVYTPICPKILFCSSKCKNQYIKVE